MKTANIRGSGVFTLKSFHTKTSPTNDNNYVDCAKCKSKISKDRTYDITHQQIIKYYKKKQGIPSMLTELYPDMHIEEYESLKNDASFAGKKLNVCDKCYIMLSDPKNKSHTVRKSPPSRASSASSTPISAPTFSTASISTPVTPKSSLSSRSSRSSTVTPSPKPAKTPLTKTPQTSTQAQSLTIDEANQEAYYLHLYEELVALREENQLLRLNLTKSESNSTQLTHQDLEPLEDASKGLQMDDSKSSSSSGREDINTNGPNAEQDEQINNLMTTIRELQSSEQYLQQQLERCENQMQQEGSKHQKEVTRLQTTIDQLQKETAVTQERMKTVVDGDRAHMTDLIESMKKRLTAEKVTEIQAVRTQLEEEFSQEKTSMRQQIDKLAKTVVEEKNYKETLTMQIKDLTKQLDLAKARLKAGQMKEG